MKKRVTAAATVIISCVLIVCAACFAGCSGKKGPQFLDLENAEIGSVVPVYPDCEFDYKLGDGSIVHVSSMTATLSGKNTVNDGDTVEGTFYPYTISVTTKGTADSSLSGQTLYVSVTASPNTTQYGGETVVGRDGSFECEIQVRQSAIIGIYFSFILVY